MILPRREAAQVAAHLERARPGHGGALVLHGEAGLGKSVLLETVLGSAAEARILRASGAEFERELAFTALHQLCLPVLDLLGRIPAPQARALRVAFDQEAGPAPDRFLIGLAALSLLSEAATHGPVICVIDDAQWLDAGSAQALAFVARRIQAEPVAVLIATRDPEAVPALAVLPRLLLTPLTDEEATTLLTQTLRAPLEGELRRQLLAEARGNPLALVELPRSYGPAGLSGTPGQPVPDLIEREFHERLSALPERTRRLLVIAAAESLGIPGVLEHAAGLHDLTLADAEPAESAGLLEIDFRIRFRHPLVRSAIYRLATETDRKRAHHALAEAFEADGHRDRRVWHQAQAAWHPDEQLALRVEQEADKVRRRGGVAAAAAFLERSVTLTPDPARRAERAVLAAHAQHESGASDDTDTLLELADRGPLTDHWRARLLRLRGQIAFALQRDDMAPALLLKAAEQVAPLDPALARETYLEALWAATGAERNGNALGIKAVAAAIRRDSRVPAVPLASDHLLRGLATLFTEGQGTAVPLLRAAVDGFGGAADPRWLPVACRAAWDLWDEEALDHLATRCVRLTRAGGMLSLLPLALNFQAVAATYDGRFAEAGAMTEEAHAITEAIAGAATPYAAIVLAAFQGDVRRAGELFGTCLSAAAAGQGGFVTIVEYATAVLHNGRGDHQAALPPARQAGSRSRLFWSAAALPELVEAAVHMGETRLAASAVDELAELTEASGTDWGLGVLARSRALLGGAPDELFQEALARLGRCRVGVHLARTHLLYGEWLSRTGQRGQARTQLRQAHTMFDGMGATGFATRTARGLRRLGEHPIRATKPAIDVLTSQEAHIARLVAGGRTSKEVAAELFLSPRTIEAHLRNVFQKLGITSRRHLRDIDL
ncbi:ATP-binding protein [Nonomuraea sp. NPDC001699]